MEKLKIAITQGNYNGTSYELILRACEDSAMFELCTPIVYGSAKHALTFRKALELNTNFVSIRQAGDAQEGRLSIINAAEGSAEVEIGTNTADALQQENTSLAAAMRDLVKGEVDALVLAPTIESAKCPANASEIIVTEKAYFMPLTKEPTAEDIIRFRDILERDFDIRSPRIAIVQENNMQNADLTSQVTTEQGINTYGPYTQEQILAEDTVCHFDGIIIADGETAMQHLITELTQETPVRFFAGMESVVTAVYHPTHMNEAGKGTAKISELTQPIYTAIDIVRNRAFYDEARQNILPKLFRDKREDRKQNEATQANTNNDNTEKAS